MFRARGNSPEGEWPNALGLMWIVCFFIAFDLYAGMTRERFPYRWALFEGLFVVSVAGGLCWKGRLADLPRYLVGRLVPTARGLLLAAGPLILTALAFYAMAWRHPGRAGGLGLDYLFHNVVLAPLTEELVFRGVLLTILLAYGKGPRWWLVLLSAFIFAACHLVDNLRHAFWITVLGLLTGAALVGTRSVAVCILFHTFWNAMAACPFMSQASPPSP
jgi:membrane protease YdiL (CAAX protease family)